MQLVVCEVPPECLVAASGELDLASAPALTAALWQLDPGCEAVTLDLRGLAFMDIAGLEAIFDAQRVTYATGRRLHVLGPRGEVARVLDATGTRHLVN